MFPDFYLAWTINLCAACVQLTKERGFGVRKKVVILAFMFCISLGILNGCKQAEEVYEPTESNAPEDITEVDSSEGKGLRSEDEDIEEPLEEPGELRHESRQPGTVLEDEEAVYFCGRQHILKWNKETQTTDIIWMSDKEEIKEDAYAYNSSHGILIEDKIYFIESWAKDMVNPMASETLHALSVVNTDGSSYQEIEQISDETHLLLLDGILYFSYDWDSGALEGYVVDAAGDLMLESGRVVTEPVNVPKDYMEVSCYKNGVRQLTSVESAYRFGYYLLRDENYEFCAVNQNTGEKEVLPEEYGNMHLLSWNNNYFLMEDYAENKMYLVNHDTWERNLLIEQENDVSIINMDEEYVYWQRDMPGDDFSQHIYERIDIETGTVEELFVLDSFVGMLNDSPWYLMDISVLNGYLYYVGTQDYKHYLMRRDVNMPNAEEIIGEAFFDSGISEIGEIKIYKEAIYSDTNPELMLGEMDLEWLVVDEKFAGAAQINAVLEEEQQAAISYERDIAKDMEELAMHTLSSSLTSKVSPIYYFNERFISFTQQGYDYTGGAHGMPYWVPHTFDLETGNELMLSDIIADSEEELKEVVTEYFTAMYQVEPSLYWDDAIDNVYEWTTMNSNYYLNKDGIVFYFGPYELASYAAGFQEVVVPYEEFELRIPMR